MNPEDLIEALAKLDEEKKREAEKVKAQFEAVLHKLTSPLSRFQQGKAPFQVGYDPDKIFDDCSYISRVWNSEIKQDLYYCRYPEHLEAYTVRGCMLLSCEGCPIKEENDKLADFQSLIHSIQNTLKDR